MRSSDAAPSPRPASPLDAPPRRRSPVGILAGLGAAAAHAALFGLALTAGGWARSADTPPPVAVTELIEVQQEPEPPPPEPPPPEPEPEPAKAPEPPPAPKPVALKAPKPVREPKPEQAPPPAAAQAAQVMAQEPKPDVIDFGDTFVQGNATSYAGGVTEAGGTSKVAVRDANARAHGVPGGQGSAPTAVDLSREASLAEGTHWDCPFPEEADSEGLDTAVVLLKVQVATNGAVEKVDVAKDPGFGFGREARRCALRKRWQPARDRNGLPIGKSSTLSVRFQR